MFLENPDGFTTHGQGHCKDGYYMGEDGYLSEEACTKICMDEVQCTYVAWLPFKRCSRYKEKDCVLLADNDKRKQYTTFRKSRKSMYNCSIAIHLIPNSRPYSCTITFNLNTNHFAC